MSLDLSHNHITDLPLILQQLQQLPKLRALHLQGNPISLLPHYKASVLQQLPILVYLDGQVC
jgi:Leucine-rich repeat (LRR) protein